MDGWTRVSFELAPNEYAGWTYAIPDCERKPFYVFLKGNREGVYFQLQEVREPQDFCTKSGVDERDVPPVTTQVEDSHSLDSLLRKKGAYRS